MFSEVEVLTREIIPVNRFPLIDLNGGNPKQTTIELNRVLKDVVNPHEVLQFPACAVQLEWHGDFLKAGAGTYNFCLRAHHPGYIRGQKNWRSKIFLPQQDPVQDMTPEDPGIFGFEKVPGLHFEDLDLVMPYYNRLPSGDVEEGGTAIKGKHSNETHVERCRFTHGHNGADLYRCHYSVMERNRVVGAPHRDALRVQSDFCSITKNFIQGDLQSDGRGEINMGIRVAGIGNRVIDNHIENIYFEALICSGGGEDLLVPTPGRSPVFHGNIFEENYCENCQWGITQSAGWNSIFRSNVFKNCQRGAMFHHHYAFEKGVTLQYSQIDGNQFIDCGDGWFPVIWLTSSHLEDVDDPALPVPVRVLNNSVTNNTIIRTTQGPNVSHVMRIQAPNTDVSGNKIFIHPSPNQEHKGELIGIAVRGEDAYPHASGSTFDRNRVWINQPGMQTIYGLYQHGRGHEDLEWTFNRVTLATKEDVKTATAQTVGYGGGITRVIGNRYAGAKLGLRIRHTEHERELNNGKACDVAEDIEG